MCGRITKIWSDANVSFVTHSSLWDLGISNGKVPISQEQTPMWSFLFVFQVGQAAWISLSRAPERRGSSAMLRWLYIWISTSHSQGPGSNLNLKSAPITDFQVGLVRFSYDYTRYGTICKSCIIYVCVSRQV